MQIIINEYFTKLLADVGKVICSKDGIWDIKSHITEVDLGMDDSPNNYFEKDEVSFIDEE